MRILSTKGCPQHLQTYDDTEELSQGRKYPYPFLRTNSANLSLTGYPTDTNKIQVQTLGSQRSPKSLQSVNVCKDYVSAASTNPMINDDMSMWNCPVSTFVHRMQSTCPVDSIGCPSPFEKSERREIGTKGHVSHHGLKVNNNMEKDCLQINIIDWVKYFHIICYGISDEPVCPGCLGCLRCSGKHLHWKRFNEKLWGETIPESDVLFLKLRCARLDWNIQL